MALRKRLSLNKGKDALLTHDPDVAQMISPLIENYEIPPTRNELAYFNIDRIRLFSITKRGNHHGANSECYIEEGLSGRAAALLLKAYRSRDP